MNEYVPLEIACDFPRVVICMIAVISRRAAISQGPNIDVTRVSI